MYSHLPESSICLAQENKNLETITIGPEELSHLASIDVRQAVSFCQVIQMANL